MQAARQTNGQFAFRWVGANILSRKYSTNGTALNTSSSNCEPMTATSTFSVIGFPFRKESGISFRSAKPGPRSERNHDPDRTLQRRFPATHEMPETRPGCGLDRWSRFCPDYGQTRSSGLRVSIEPFLGLLDLVVNIFLFRILRIHTAFVEEAHA